LECRSIEILGTANTLHRPCTEDDVGRNGGLKSGGETTKKNRTDQNFLKWPFSWARKIKKMLRPQERNQGHPPGGTLSLVKSWQEGANTVRTAERQKERKEHPKIDYLEPGFHWD